MFLVSFFDVRQFWKKTTVNYVDKFTMSSTGNFVFSLNGTREVFHFCFYQTLLHIFKVTYKYGGTNGFKTFSDIKFVAHCFNY